MSAAHVALLDADPSFAAGVPDDDRALARRVLQAPLLDLPAGDWTPPRQASWPAPVCGLLILDGVVARQVALADRVATQLLGPGDVLQPWARGTELLPSSVCWSMHEPGSAAVLDGRFATAARRWPALAAIVQERLAAAADRLATHLAICQLPRVEQRVLALLWHLAERFGRVTPDGVAVPLRLTHRLIGELAGAQRPTVTLALAALLDEGRIARRADGSLLLAADSWAGLEPAVPFTRTAPAAPPLTVAPAERGTAELTERVRLLRSDFTAQRERTVAAVSRSAALRRRRAAATAARTERAAEGDGAQSGEAA
jgi:CRP/FNR family transcriptional regulator, cyclic AMP receptor protein